MSEDITPRMPQDDRIDRLFSLVLEIKAELDARKGDTKPMLEEIRNTVASISADVAELKKEVAKMNRSHMSVVQLLGDLAGRTTDLNERVKQLEEKK